MKLSITTVLISITVVALPAAFADEPILKVMSVTIDQNSNVNAGPKFQATSGIVSSKGGKDPFETIQEKDAIIQKLEAQLNRNKARKERAKGIATVKMSSAERGNFAVPLDIDDLFETESSSEGVTSVNVIAINEGGSAIWTPAIANASSTESTGNSSSVTSQPPSIPNTSDPTLDPFRRRQGSSIASATTPDTSQKGHTGSTSRIHMGLEAWMETLAPKDNGLKSIGGPPAGSFAPNSPTDRQAPVIQLTNVHDVTFQQPAPRWEIAYELKNDRLFQLAHIGNFTGVPWPAGAEITLTDVQKYNKNQKIVFKLRSDLAQNADLLQTVGAGYQVTELLSYSLGSGSNPKKSLQLNLPDLADKSQLPFFPAGQLRSTLAAGTSVTSEVSYSKSIFSIGPDYTIQLSGKKDEALPIGKIVSMDGGKFVVHSLRRSTTSVSHAGVRNKEIQFNKAVEEGWSLVGTDWTAVPSSENPKRYSTTQKLGVSGETIIVDLLESKELTLNFYVDTERARLAELIASNNEFRSPGNTLNPTDRPQKAGLELTEAESILSKVLANQTEIDKKKSRIDSLTTEIAALEKAYDEYDASNVPDVHLGNRALRGMKERIIRLDIEKTNLLRESSRLKLEIDADLFPALEPQPTTGDGLYSLVR